MVANFLTGLLAANASSNALAPALSQVQTNGLSMLGTLSAPTLPDFLTDNALPSGFPWGTASSSDTNYYQTTPDTGKTRYYTLELKRAVIAPDGVEKPAILVNGQFPGPTLTANWGDWFEITVKNSITGVEEGTSIHWHGLLQKQTPFYDGVPGITQCPIPPGTSFTYRFRADLYGSSWYHAHSAQYSAGVVGPMIIYGPKNAPYDSDLGPIILTDYYHREYFEIIRHLTSSEPFAPDPPPAGQVNAIPFSNNNLIQGKMNTDCTNVPRGRKCTTNAGLAKFRFRSGKTYRLRLINTSAEGVQRFSIDGHTMSVIANDFVEIKPYDIQVVTLGVGQRSDVLVKATGKSGDAYWMRSNISTVCSAADQPLALAAIYYENANTNAKPTSTAQPAPVDNCANDALTKTEPFYKITPGTPATTQVITLNFAQNATGQLNWEVNGKTFRVNYNHPPLLAVQQGNGTTFPESPQLNLFDFNRNSSVRVIVNNLTPVAHPMHFHGHNMFVLYSGTSPWDGNVVRPANPQRRDVEMLIPLGTFVFQFDNDNPGVWPFHCHIAWHASSGLFANFLVGEDNLAGRRFPANVFDNCKAWDAYTKRAVVAQIDSGN
ncbi:MAG: hypothetical protein M1814_000003 [Vezdaea aestivalis]|nr:MAG: hypothetical protein M1814_000003 [Vezdaea aestivalis]